VLQRLEEAILAASGQRGPAVLLLAKDLQQAPAKAADTPPAKTAAPGRAWAPPLSLLEPGLALLRARPVVIIAGEEIARSAACEELARFADLVDAKVAVTPDARDAYDNFGSRFVGVAGAMGHPGVADALSGAAVCVLAGTRLPVLARQGLEGSLQEKRVLSLGRGAPFIALPLCSHLSGAAGSLLRAFNAELGRETDTGAAAQSAHSMRAASPQGPSDPHRERTLPLASTRADAVAEASPSDGSELTTARVLRALERALPEGATVIVDAGNTGASAVHHLGVRSGGRWLLAMGMAGMGYAFGAAVGATCATQRRTVVCAGDGAFFMHGFEIHTALEHALPITFLIFNNNAHGMCLVRERLLLGEEHGYNVFRPAHIAAGMTAMLPGLAGYDCTTLPELESALRRSLEHQGPVVIAIELPGVEVPPFAAFRQALDQTTQSIGIPHLQSGRA
jgi:acetolactate synthase-1/2/3 large subunit